MSSKKARRKNFSALFLIIKNSETIYSATVNKEKFNPLLTKELRAYGVLLFPSFNGIDEERKELVFHHSVSIPITDVGVSATLMIDFSGKEKIKEY